VGAVCPHYRIAVNDVSGELRRFWAARRRARREIEALQDRRPRPRTKYAAIFGAHLMILDDRKTGARPRNGSATSGSTRMGAGPRPSAADRRDAERRGPGPAGPRSDIQDVYERLQNVLGGQTNQHARELELADDTVVVAHSLSPSDAMCCTSRASWASSPSRAARLAHGDPGQRLEIPACWRRAGDGDRRGRRPSRRRRHARRGGRASGAGVAASYRRERDAWRSLGQVVEAAPGRS